MRIVVTGGCGTAGRWVVSNNNGQTTLRAIGHARALLGDAPAHSWLDAP